MARVYVASSWRNAIQPLVVSTLREAGHEVYDFRNPESRTGFAWSQTRPAWADPTGTTATADELNQVLAHPVAQAGFASDHAAMEWADTFVMVLPCGKSAHLELGWACGKGKRTLILMPNADTPELMYLEADGICKSVADVLERVAHSSAAEVA